MGLFKTIGNFFKNLFGKVGDFIQNAWKLAEPFLVEVLNQSAAAAVSALKDLAITAIQQVASQGLPTDDAKRKAFADIMTAAAKQKGIELGDFELNLLRETAYAIYRKATENK